MSAGDGRPAAIPRGSRLQRLRHRQAYFPDFDLSGRTPATVALTHLEDRDARRPGLPPHTFEDGLLRSVGAGPSVDPISLIGAGTVERLASAWGAGDLLAEAEALMELKREAGLSQVNAHPAADLPPAGGRARLLVIDRRADERVLGGAMAEPQAYADMLRRARREHPQAQLIALSPRAGRAIDADTLALAEVVLEADVDASDLLSQVEGVYTWGSLLGWEALLLGRPVTSFGRPFYARSGLTLDRSGEAIDHRRSLPEVFAAAYLADARYVDPLSGQACSARLAFERLAAMRAHARRVAGRWRGSGLPPPKQAVLKAFLAGPMSTFSAGDRPQPGERMAIWASRPNGAATKAVAAGAPVVRLEDGFVRSAGLGSSFSPAFSLVLDGGGIYYDPGSDSDLQRLLRNRTFSTRSVERARAFRQAIVSRRMTKYNLGGPPPERPSTAAKVILVPGQVDNDQSVLRGGGLNNSTLLRTIRQANPEAWLIYKPHPDVIAGNRPGRLDMASMQALADSIVTDADIDACIQIADEVHTLTSLTGFEALLRGKPVVTYGWPFYAGWGLTEDRGSAPTPDRGRRLSLDELVAGALLDYPLYLDPLTWLPCDAETFVSRLDSLLARNGRRGPPAGPARRYLAAAGLMLRPPRPPPY